MPEIPLGNGLLALVDPFVQMAVGNLEWGLLKGKPYLISPPPGWNKPRYLARLVVNVSDPNLKVIHLNGHTLDCRYQNLLARSPAECAKFRAEHPLPEAEVKASSYSGIVWDPNVRAWTVAYQDYQLPAVDPQWFRHEQDAAREFDRCLMGQVELKALELANLKIRIIEDEQALDELRQTVPSLLNFPAL